MLSTTTFAILTAIAPHLLRCAAVELSAACTGISLTTIDGRSVHARTIEWGAGPLDSELIVTPRNNQFTSILARDARGVS